MKKTIVRRYVYITVYRYIKKLIFVGLIYLCTYKILALDFFDFLIELNPCILW